MSEELRGKIYDILLDVAANTNEAITATQNIMVLVENALEKAYEDGLCYDDTSVRIQS